MRRLYKELENYGKSDFYPFHMPGHKRNKACIEGDFPIERDITEIDGFDDLHHSEGILLEAQNALSRMYGTRKSFFSVNGSTAGILTAISASVKKGGQILVARNIRLFTTQYTSGNWFPHIFIHNLTTIWG